MTSTLDRAALGPPLDEFLAREGRLAGRVTGFVRCGDLAFGTAPAPVARAAVTALVTGGRASVEHAGRTWCVAGVPGPLPATIGVSVPRRHDDPADALARFAELVAPLLARAAEHDPFLALVAASPSLAPLAATLRRVAPTPLPVLVLGETGVGKEELARAIHRGARRPGRFVAENCAALPETLLEAELFGVRRGAFTGADSDRRGRILEAEHGTLLLDEIGDLSPSLQAKLLRVVQEREVRPLGGDRGTRIDVRFVSATHRAVDAGDDQRFRRDLYYRLAGLEVRVPPLRERPGDVPWLAAALLARLSAEGLGPGRHVAARALAPLARAYFPGNVRELDNLLRRAASLSPGPRIPSALLVPARAPGPESGNLEVQAIVRALAQAGGVKADAARRLGWTRQKLYRRLDVLGVDAPHPARAAVFSAVR